MKIYKELYFKGSPSELQNFVDHFKGFCNDNWDAEAQTERWEDYLFFNYKGSEVEQARVSIYLGNDLQMGEIRVGNIVPSEKSKLSIDEYNDILTLFYADVIIPYKKTHFEIAITQPTDGIFNPTSIISELALKKLKSFCNLANKSTGSSHPSDQERWFDFICQTVDDGQIFDYVTLSKFLQDTDYWGEKDSNFIGAMGCFAWSENKAEELALEYENACNILQYYKRKRGV